MHLFLHCKSISCFEQLLDGKLCISLHEFISQYNMCGLVGIRKKYPKIKEGNEMHHSCLWELCNYTKSLMSYDFLVSPTFLILDYKCWTLTPCNLYCTSYTYEGNRNYIKTINLYINWNDMCYQNILMIKSIVYFDKYKKIQVINSLFTNIMSSPKTFKRLTHLMFTNLIFRHTNQ